MGRRATVLLPLTFMEAVMHRFSHWAGVALAVLLAAPAHADVEALRDHLAQEYPDFAVDSIEPAPLEGMYEVISGTEVVYISDDGRFIVRGELLDMVEGRNLTAEVQERISHREVDALGEENMVVYEPEDGEVAHRITVFTDTTCPYCRDLHEELLEAIDDHGIQLRYLMFPRAGVDSPAAETLRDIWCADDPQRAMTLAKRGEEIAERDSDCEPPVAEQFQLGREIGVSGTPYTLLNEEGPVFAGYRPVEQLVQMSRDSGGFQR